MCDKNSLFAMMAFEVNKWSSWISILLVILFTHCDNSTFTSGSPIAKIVGGWSVDMRETSYHVSLELYFNEEFGSMNTTPCGSTIISNQWVITAAHCPKAGRETMKYFAGVHLIIGTDDLNDRKNMPKTINGTIPRADLVICHPNSTSGWGFDIKTKNSYRWTTHDICLIRIDHNLTFGEYIGKAGLPWDAYDESFNDKELQISGHGMYIYRDPNFAPSDKLFTIKQRTLPIEECVEISGAGSMPDQNFCAVNVDDDVYRCPSFGDSGGGMIYKDSITGCPIVRGILTSVKGDCNLSWSVNVMVYKDWIKQTMERFTRLEHRITYIYPARNRGEG